MRPLTEKLSKKLDQQTKTRALVTDTHLRLKGFRDVYALGDCATIDNSKVLDVIMEKYAIV
jgi:NADH dehydrogenase FAD-containing subunit